MRLRGRIIGTEAISDVLISDGKIQDISQVYACEKVGEDQECLIAPGFIDLQVNGWCGRNINRETATPDDLREVVRELHAYGVTTFLPTVTTHSQESLCRSLRAVRKATEKFPEVSHACRCIHLEGPYISPEEGPRGAHPLEHVRPPDLEEFQKLQDAAEGQIGYVTLAPEVEGALPLIEKLTQLGIVVGIGHASPTPHDIENAVKAGARVSTHLGNGCHAQIDRHRNYIWEQLACDALCATLIADGHHLPPAVVKCMVRSKGVDRCALVTDAIGLAGKPPGRYTDWEVAEVELTEDGAARLAGTPFLAGAVMPITRCIENTVRFAGVSLDKAISMVTVNPAKILGLTEDIGRVEVGKSADLVLFHWDEEHAKMEIVQTIARGEVVFAREKSPQAG